MRSIFGVVTWYIEDFDCNCFTFRDVLIVVQSTTNNPTSSENLRTSVLKPYQADIKGPYVTAYCKAGLLPLAFVIGDGKEYNSEEKTYFNQPLEQNSSYIAFLRFFEDKVNIDYRCCLLSSFPENLPWLNWTYWKIIILRQSTGSSTGLLVFVIII